MAINIAFQNPQSGDIRFVKVGWSWVLFFFSGILGIPLFQWRLYAWGSVFAAMSFISLACNISGTNAGAQFIVLIVVLLQVWIGDLLGDPRQQDHRQKLSQFWMAIPGAEFRNDPICQNEMAYLQSASSSPHWRWPILMCNGQTARPQ